jgi:hypothetical protein
MQRRGLAGRGRVGGDHDLAHAAFAHTRVQLGDLQVLRIDPVDRRERATEDVVTAPKLVRALDRDHVRGLLDHADDLRVSPLV